MVLFHWLFFENIITSWVIGIMETIFTSDQIKYGSNIFFQSLPPPTVIYVTKLWKMACFTLQMILGRVKQK